MKEFIHNKLGFLLVLFLMINLFVNAQQSGEKSANVKIGLLVNKQNKELAQYGAQKAIQEINQVGGIHGKPVKLIIKSVEGEWGAGSKEIVDLVFKENVKAIIGAIDGENSHLAEQVIAKTQLLYISAWATDPSLSEAYVPWYFSIVPTDYQQAVAILEDIKVKKGLKKALVIHDQTYDAEQALKSFYKVSKKYVDLRLLPVSHELMDADTLISGLEKNDLEALIFLGRHIPVSQFLGILQASGKSIPVYGNLSVLASMESEYNHLQFYKHFYVIDTGFPFDPITQSNEIDMLAQPPFISDAIASYTYDSVMLIAEALSKSKKDDKNLRESMSKINYQGVTGAIEFDELGRLKKRAELRVLKR